MSTKAGSRNGHRRAAFSLSNKRGKSSRKRGAYSLAAGDLNHPVDATPQTTSRIDDERIIIAKRARYNPLRNLTPDLLTTHMEAFRMGYLWSFALTMDAMYRRDPVIMSAKSKREKAVSRHGWEIVKTEEIPRAVQHAAALKYFYDHCQATDALEQDDKGGFSLLLQQMMRSEGFRYQNHEIIWSPRPNAVTYVVTPAESKTNPLTGEVTKTEAVLGTMDGLTATFRAVPLWFFENITGKLRYLKQFGELYGQPMEEGGWLTTAGDGLMEPTAVAYCYKHLLALKDWASLMERWGDTKAWGQSTQGPGTPEWEAMKQALHDLATPEGTAVVKADAEGHTKINLLESRVVQGGESIYERLIELMDRYISTMWRGGDLSTLSRSGGAGQSGHSTGASVQGEESLILETQDASLMTETLNAMVDKWVIRYLFDEEPLAFIKISRPEAKSIDLDLKVDQALAAGGAKQKNGAVAERFSRQVENPDDFFTTPQGNATNPDGKGQQDNNAGGNPDSSADNEALDIPISVKAIIKDADDNVLLLKDSRTRFWDLPGGHTEGDESLQQALARELMEETGLTLTGATELRRMNLELGGTPTQTFFFNATVEGDPHRVSWSDEHTSARFVPMESLHALDTGAFRAVLAGLRESPATSNDGSRFITRAELQQYSSAVNDDVLAPIRKKYGPLLKELHDALAMADEPMNAALFKLRPQLEELQRDIPKLLKANPKAAKVLKKLMVDALVKGAKSVTVTSRRAPVLA